MIIIGWII